MKKGLVSRDFIYKVIVSFVAAATPGGCDDADFRRDSFAAIEGLPEIERAMFVEVNRVREEQGLSPLQFDDALTAAARQHSDEMKRLYYFAHESPTPGLKDVSDRVYSAGLTDISVAENLASENSVPPSADAEAVGRKLTELLLASPYHRENILDRRFTHSGIGCVVSEEGTLFCTQVFSKRAINFKYIKLKKEVKDTLKVTLVIRSDDVIGVWLDEVNTYIFEPEEGLVVLNLSFREVDGPRKVVFARRRVGEYGTMKGFFMGSFDPEKPINFSAGITDVDVISEVQSRGETAFYVLEAEGKLLTSAGRLKIADGNAQHVVKLKSKKFKVKYPILAGSGLHEIYFVTGDETAHGLKIDADRPVTEAFCQIAPGE
jgi:hypothetical protein